MSVILPDAVLPTSLISKEEILAKGDCIKRSNVEDSIFSDEQCLTEWDVCSRYSYSPSTWQNAGSIYIQDDYESMDLQGGSNMCLSESNNLYSQDGSTQYTPDNLPVKLFFNFNTYSSNNTTYSKLSDIPELQYIGVNEDNLESNITVDYIRYMTIVDGVGVYVCNVESVDSTETFLDTDEIILSGGMSVKVDTGDGQFNGTINGSIESNDINMDISNYDDDSGSYIIGKSDDGYMQVNMGLDFKIYKNWSVSIPVCPERFIMSNTYTKASSGYDTMTYYNDNIEARILTPASTYIIKVEYDTYEDDSITTKTKYIKYLANYSGIGSNIFISDNNSVGYSSLDEQYEYTESHLFDINVFSTITFSCEAGSLLVGTTGGIQIDTIGSFEPSTFYVGKDMKGEVIEWSVSSSGWSGEVIDDYVTGSSGVDDSSGSIGGDVSGGSIGFL